MHIEYIGIQKETSTLGFNRKEIKLFNLSDRANMIDRFLEKFQDHNILGWSRPIEKEGIKLIL